LGVKEDYEVLFFAETSKTTKYSDKNKEVLSLQRQKKRVELALVQYKISNFAEDNPDM
jgi:hypothetical protein